jgi:Fe2+ or Zn2+ uptake regulation protein
MIKTFKEIFREKGISPSYTRTRIYHYLEDSKNHPTVDEIYTELKEELPTLSKTTVYNVLNLFIEKRLAKLVNMNSSEARYELYEEEHSHFKCDVCGTIYDIPKIKTNYDHSKLGTFKVKSEEVNLSGICPKCI